MMRQPVKCGVVARSRLQSNASESGESGDTIGFGRHNQHNASESFLPASLIGRIYGRTLVRSNCPQERSFRCVDVETGSSISDNPTAPARARSWSLHSAVGPSGPDVSPGAPSSSHRQRRKEAHKAQIVVGVVRGRKRRILDSQSSGHIRPRGPPHVPSASVNRT